jgi:hypothetical protein
MKIEREIAEWMFERLDDDGELHKSHVVDEILSQHGSEFVEYTGTDYRIDPLVLKEFRKLCKGLVQWHPRRRCWTFRE